MRASDNGFHVDICGVFYDAKFAVLVDSFFAENKSKGDDALLAFKESLGAYLVEKLMSRFFMALAMLVLFTIEHC